MIKGKACSYLIDDGIDDKKAKDTQRCVIKRKLKLEDYKNCFGETRLENKISHLVKNKVDVDNLKEDHKELKKQ